MSHAQKMLDRLNKKVSKGETAAPETTTKVKAKKGNDPTFREQYEVIRDDIMKLRTDLQKGYDMAKDVVEKRGILRQLLKAR